MVHWLVTGLGCAPTPPTSVSDVRTELPAGASAFVPLGPVPDLDPRIVELGDRLFHDPRLSADDTVSCATCHDLAHGGVDHKKSAVGIGGQVGPINTPTVFNASLNFAQFWNGRAATLEDQANGPPLAAAEMGSSWPQILGKLGADPEMVSRFAVFPDGLTEANVRFAIATFERTLLTPAPFDRYLAGDTAALSDEARRGLALFSDYGCVACHQGQGIGGNMYQRFGVMGDYFADRGNVTEADLGRFTVTQREEDRHVFKVPSLRNVAKTAPYFHDGSAPTLADAVKVMGRYQLGRQLADEDVALLVAFLESLTGDRPPRSAL